MSATRYDPLQRAGGCSIPAPSRVRPAGRDLCAPGGQIYSHLGYWFTRGYLRGDSPVRMGLSLQPHRNTKDNVGVGPHVPSKMIFRSIIPGDSDHDDDYWFARNLQLDSNSGLRKFIWSSLIDLSLLNFDIRIET